MAWLFNTLILRGLQSRFQDHPLKIAAVKQYTELINLDVDSESAIKGTARALGLPDEQVRTWIIENKGKLHTK